MSKFLTRIREELEKCTNALNDITRRYQNIQEEHKALQSTVHVLQEQLNESLSFKQKNEDLSKELDTLQEKQHKLETIIHLLEEENALLKEERDSGLKRSSFLQTQLNNVKSDFNVLKKDFEDMTTQKEKLHQLLQGVSSYENSFPVVATQN